MLTKRLEKILSVLPRVDVLADVGCDHGYIGLQAIERDIAGRVIFTDISAPSLQKARQNCPQGLKTHATFVCRDGLGDIACDCAVIAGMGGLEIISILRGAKALPQILVLQPMRNQIDVRKYLLKDYCMVSDEKFFDGKFYDLIVARKCDGGSTLTEDEICFGKTNISHPTQEFVDYLNKEKQEYFNILQQCSNAEVLSKLDDVCRILNTVTEVSK